MKTLQACYELDFSKINFLERKQRITHPKTMLIGPPKSGKSYLIYDYLSGFDTKEYLYIDLDDFKNTQEDIFSELESFIKRNEIKVLILEDFSFEYKLPNCESIIITTRQPKKQFGFKELILMPLDFEEFLLHDHRHQNTTNSFNYFFKYGNLPGVINIEEHKKEKRLQEIIKIYSKDETEKEVLKILFFNSDEKKSLHQLFTTLKKEIKISKDKFYALCKKFEENHLVYFIEKFNQPKAVKKIYSYNHSFVNSISHTKKFKNEFTNMVFLELIAQKKYPTYLDNIDFYIKKSNTIILCLPFFNNLLINSIAKKVFNSIDDLNIKKIFIITIGNSDSFFYDNLEIQVLPFYEWAAT